MIVAERRRRGATPVVGTEVGQLAGDLVVALVEVGPQLLVAFAEPARERMVMQLE